MYEWALAQSIVAAIAGEVEKSRLREVLKVDVRVGELQQIDLDIFRFVMGNVLKTYNLPMDMSRIVVSKDRSMLKCRACGAEWNAGESGDTPYGCEGEAIRAIPEITHICARCPGCASPDFDVLRGRGVWVESIEGKT